MVKKQIKDTIQKHNLINSGEHIVLGLSGGPDSVCLFSVLKELSQEIGFRLHAVHVNHKFRPGEAEKDRDYVEALCAKHNIVCDSYAYDCNAIAKSRKVSSEEAGRLARYDAFRKIVKEIIVMDGVPAEKVKIAVAQNADDQAETLLFRLMRGTGTDGLAGMAYSRMEQNICVIRPLLDTWRADIEKYCDENDLQPRTDKTNLQPIYTRNKIRLDLLPNMEANFNPNIMEALNRLSKIAGEDKAFLWKQAETSFQSLRVAGHDSVHEMAIDEAIDSGFFVIDSVLVSESAAYMKELQKIKSPVTADKVLLDQKGLYLLEAAIRHRVIMKAFQEIGLDQDISIAHLEAADSILDAEGESKSVEFPNGYKMTVRYGQAVFLAPRAKDARSCYKLSIHVVDIENKEHLETLLTQAPQYALRKGSSTDSDRFLSKAKTQDKQPSAQTAVFDYDKITAVFGEDPKIELRTRREGDYIPIIDKNRHDSQPTFKRKKLKKLLIDEKVPKEERDNIEFVAIGSEILWIPRWGEQTALQGWYANSKNNGFASGFCGLQRLAFSESVKKHLLKATQGPKAARKLIKRDAIYNNSKFASTNYKFNRNLYNSNDLESDFGKKRHRMQSENSSHTKNAAKSAPSAKPRYNPKYKLDKDTKKALILELFCEI